MNNYSDAPQSITEIRATREHSGRLWTPRDVLIATLRDIDSGEINPTDLAVCYVETDKEGKEASGHFAAYKSMLRLLGVSIKLTKWISGEEP